jgi:erlin
MHTQIHMFDCEHPAKSRNIIICITIVVSLFLAMSIIFTCIHQIEEGHVGIYKRGGEVLEGYTTAGYNFKIPIITTVYEIQITYQTDIMQDVPCGTNKGVTIYFPFINISNMLRPEHARMMVKNYTVNYDKLLIFDKVQHELNQICSINSIQDMVIDKFHEIDDNLTKTLQKFIDEMSEGLEIRSVRVSKPTLPESLKQKYIAIEEEILNQEIKLKARAVEKTKEETVKQLQDIQNEVLLAKMINEKNISEVENQKYLGTQKSLADAEAYRIKEMANSESYKINMTAYSNKQLHTDSYLMVVRMQSLMNNSKLFFEGKIPSYIGSFGN